MLLDPSFAHAWIAGSSVASTGTGGDTDEDLGTSTEDERHLRDQDDFAVGPATAPSSADALPPQSDDDSAVRLQSESGDLPEVLGPPQSLGPSSPTDGPDPENVTASPAEDTQTPGPDQNPRSSQRHNSQKNS